MLRSQWNKMSAVSQAHYARHGDGIEDDPIELTEREKTDAAERAEYQAAWKRGFVNLNDAERAIAARWFPNMFRGREG